MKWFAMTWIGVAVLMAALSAWLGSRLRRNVWGIFIDSRNTWSLSQFQLVCWTFVGLPLLLATAVWRSTESAATAWDFEVPGELLALMGISIASAVSSLAIKSSKDSARPHHVAARANGEKPPFSDMFAIEEGAAGLKAIDITKFQNFVITVGLLLSYVWIVIKEFSDLESGLLPDSLPKLSEAMIGLLALSHGGYLVGKIPNRPGDPSAPAIAASPAVPAQPARQAGVGEPEIAARRVQPAISGRAAIVTVAELG